MLSRREKWSSSKVKKIDHPWFLSKNRPFSYKFFFWAKCKKEIFFDTLDSKEYFLDLKSEVLAKLKKSTFSKGVSPWFLSKNRPFSDMFCLAKKARKKHFLIFWIENKVFWTPKVKFSQSRKKRHFANGLVHGFCQKTDLFLICFFFEQTKAIKKHFLILWIEENAF